MVPSTAMRSCSSTPAHSSGIDEAIAAQTLPSRSLTIVHSSRDTWQLLAPLAFS